MSFILGTRFARTKKIRNALTTVFGVGRNKANKICNILGFCETYKVNELTKNQIDQLVKILHKDYLIDSELLRVIQNDVKRLIQIGCYRGIRHNEGLPLRGQRTHTNAKTSRRNKVLKNRN